MTYCLQIGSQSQVQLGQLPVCAGQKTKCHREGHEDKLEDDVGSDAADRVHEAKEAHEDEEVG
jgi:hypothetical protein